MTTTYEVVKIGVARFWVDEGMYSIEQIEQLLASMKEAKCRQDEALARSIGQKEEAAAQVFNATFNKGD